MGITAVEAARIAHEHGMSLADATALQRLAATTQEAEHLAATFTGTAAPPPIDPADLTPREAQRYARKQSDLARNFQYNQQLEDALALRKRDPAAYAALDAQLRTQAAGYYLPMRDAAKAAGRDITKDGGTR